MMTPEPARSSGLRTIFSFFLGLMLTAFIGVGVYTFHPPPRQFDDQIRDLDRREQAIHNSRAPNELTTADRDSIQAITRRRNELTDAAAAARMTWGRSTSITLIVFATLAMVLSLVGSDQAPVIGNGLLLGGLFTMLYGVGWIIASDTSISRFAVMTVALAITLGLGYARFVRRASRPAAAGESAAEVSSVAELERRVGELERRLDDAASALRSSNTQSS
jgi:hypothetical protein